MLNTSSAISYNCNRKYSTKAIGIIQSVVNAPTKGMWDAQSVSQVHKFQSTRSQVGSPDGMVGPKTLGAVIGELQYVRRNADADVLKMWSYTLPSTPTQNGAINPVSEFWQGMSLPFRFEQFRGIVACGEVARVTSLFLWGWQCGAHTSGAPPSRPSAT